MAGPTGLVTGMPNRFIRAQPLPAGPSHVKETKMPKMKTKSSAKKRFKLTASGKVKAPVAFKRHNLRKRSSKMKRHARGTILLAPGDAAKVIKQFLHK
jgi:large subunit ribosomal protein L35